MSEEEIRRRKTNDREMDALVVMSQALADLDTQTCERILTWARERFVTGPVKAFNDAWIEQINGQIECIKNRAKNLGVTDRELMHAIAHLRSQRKLAPVDDDPRPGEVEGKLGELLPKP